MMKLHDAEIKFNTWNCENKFYEFTASIWCNVVWLFEHTLM